MTDAEELAELKTARHRILTGTFAVEVGYGERRIKYSSATLEALNARITQLEAIIAGDTELTRRPLGLWG